MNKDPIRSFNRKKKSFYIGNNEGVINNSAMCQYLGSFYVLFKKQNITKKNKPLSLSFSPPLPDSFRELGTNW